MDKENMLLDKIQKFDFAVQEASLFLISHPDDKNALSYYQHFQALLTDTVNEYEEAFGPLTSRSNLDNKWKYVYGPWPWEGGK